MTHVQYNPVLPYPYNLTKHLLRFFLNFLGKYPLYFNKEIPSIDLQQKRTKTHLVVFNNVPIDHLPPGLV
jgi:hypothetical protein